MSFNNFLLNKFGPQKLLTNKATSFALRYQTLFLIYLNFTFVLCVAIFELLSTVLKIVPCLHSVSSMYLVGMICSILLLKRGHHNAAGVVIFSYIHISNFAIGYFSNGSFAAMFGMFTFLNTSFFLTSSAKILFANYVACAIQMIIHVKKLLKAFEVTLFEEQQTQITSGIFVILLGFIILCGLNVTQKNVEKSLWKNVEENYEKSENLTKEVIQAMEAKDHFVSSLSHEVRNALSSLNGSVDYLLTVLKDSVYLNVLQNAKLSGEILLNLVNNSLDAAKIKADKLELSYGKASFEDVLKKTFIINSENFKSKNIFVEAHVENNVPRNLWIDSGRMLQILMNLISNSLKFTRPNGKIAINVAWHEGEQSPEVLYKPIKNRINYMYNDFLEDTADSNQSLLEFKGTEEFNPEEESQHNQNITTMKKIGGLPLQASTKSSHTLLNAENWYIKRSQGSALMRSQTANWESGYLKVQISDTGCGIHEQSIPKLFEMYTQADKSISSAYGGTGLGLWICKQLCNKMGGDITVYSQVEKGTSFLFYIPVHNVARESRTSVYVPHIRDKINALVVDDFNFNRNLHKLLLEREGVQVTLANDGKEALEKYQEKGPEYFDFILMDVNMPEMDGFTSAKKMREWEENNGLKNIDIYFVSGDYFNEDEVLTRFKTVDGCKAVTGFKFLRKPIEVEMVTNIVQKFKNKLEQAQQSCGTLSPASPMIKYKVKPFKF